MNRGFLIYNKNSETKHFDSKDETEKIELKIKPIERY